MNKKDNEKVVYVGECPICNKKSETSCLGHLTPKYCRFCGSRIDYSKSEDKSNYLKDDIEEIIIETDENNPTTIAIISDVLKPGNGYRVRVKFKSC